MPNKSESLIDGKTFSFKDISVNFENSSLSLNNEFFVRRIDLSHAVPKTSSFVYLPKNMELTTSQEFFDFSFVGYNFPGGIGKVDFELVDISASVIPDSWRENEHVKIDIHIRENIQQLEFIKSYFVYPRQAFLGTRNSIKSEVSANIYWSRRTRLDQPEDYPSENQESRVEVLSLTPEFKVRKSVMFRGRTDVTNELVTEYKELGECVKGNLLFCEKHNADCEMFFLQEAPPTAERRDFEDHDFRITENNTVCSCCWGVAPSEVTPDEFLHSYRTIIGIYPTGGEQKALKKYLRLRFPESEEDYTVTVNPWGCGNFPDLVNEQFLMDELAASGEIHATHYQIDDGWQKGRALQELTLNNRKIEADFWEISKPHLPHGFEKLISHAKANGVEPALWVAPSFNCEYRDWQGFADILFDFYKKYDIKMFKIDAVKTRTKEAEENLAKLLGNLRERSNGEIFFNLDTTNGQRPGYFMFLEYGNIFLENRYVHREAHCQYHPESTLKNLWRLTKYMRPQVLQIETADPNLINYDVYEKQNLCAPDKYPLEYWLAISMFANPLIWLAPSKLPAASKKIFREMIDLHLKYRSRIFAEEIYSIGSEPDGESLSGFVAANENGNEGMILLFRELDGPEATVWNVPYIAENIKIREIAGNTQGGIKSIGDNLFEVKMAEKASYMLLEFSKA